MTTVATQRHVLQAFAPEGIDGADLFVFDFTPRVAARFLALMRQLEELQATDLDLQQFVVVDPTGGFFSPADFDAVEDNVPLCENGADDRCERTETVYAHVSTGFVSFEALHKYADCSIETEAIWRETIEARAAEAQP